MHVCICAYTCACVCMFVCVFAGNQPRAHACYISSSIRMCVLIQEKNAVLANEAWSVFKLFPGASAVA